MRDGFGLPVGVALGTVDGVELGWSEGVIEGGKKDL